MAASIDDAQNDAHSDLRILLARLDSIYTSIANFEPLTEKPPIIDSSTELTTEDTQWRQQENIPGLRGLKESVRRDLDVLESFLADPKCASLPALSTNAPYLIAVWNEVLCAPAPITSIFKSFPLNGQPSSNSHRKGSQRSAGVKVDVVAENGRQWIRVNTVKNSRMLSELCEIDSYLTDSEDDSDDPSAVARPTLAQTEFDNSVLKMGRSLLAAAKDNPVPGTSITPRVILRLTRLDPSPMRGNGQKNDPRIAQTIHCLREMGVDVRLGERGEISMPVSPSPSLPNPLQPTVCINLDLSLVIALVSDLTHSPLPRSAEEAKARFAPPHRYVEWKKLRVALDKGRNKVEKADAGEDGEDVALAAGNQSRALANQVLQEMRKGLLQEICDRLSALSPSKPSFDGVEFWTTREARDRCIRIVSQIGGPNEQRRAHALLYPSLSGLTTAEAEEAYWRDSRYPPRFIPLLPIRLYTSSVSDPSLGADPATLPSFFKSLSMTCIDILAQETTPHPRALPLNAVDEKVSRTSDSLPIGGEIERATVTRANPRLTKHTVQTMRFGAELGWTTLTANKTSVKAILREMKVARMVGKLDSVSTGTMDGNKAAMWIVDPRSLAEGMRSD